MKEKRYIKMTKVFLVIIVILLAIIIMILKNKERNDNATIKNSETLEKEKILKEVYSVARYAINNLNEYTIYDIINKWEEKKVYLLFSMLGKEAYPTLNQDASLIAYYALRGMMSSHEDRSDNEAIISMYISIIKMSLETYEKDKDNFVQRFDVLKGMVTDYFYNVRKNVDESAWHLAFDLDVEKKNYKETNWFLLAINLQMYDTLRNHNKQYPEKRI